MIVENSINSRKSEKIKKPATIMKKNRKEYDFSFLCDIHSELSDFEVEKYDFSSDLPKIEDFFKDNNDED